jgi:hypothetical protein
LNWPTTRDTGKYFISVSLASAGNSYCIKR